MKLFLNKVDSICGSRWLWPWFLENLVLYYFFVWEAVDVGSEVAIRHLPK